MSKTELERELKEALEFYRTPGKRINRLRLLSSMFPNEIGQEPENEADIAVAVREVLRAELEHRRQRLGATVAEAKPQSAVQQFEADRKAEAAKLELLSLLWAYYYDELGKQQLADLSAVTVRRIEQKLDEGITELAQIIVLREAEQRSQRVGASPPVPTPAQASAAAPVSRAQYIRTTLLKKIHDTWITGFLEQSLHPERVIGLHTTARPDTVLNPWYRLVQPPDQSSTEQTQDIPIIDLFERSSRELLILGAPGAGKTIALLVIARELLAYAEQHVSAPIPIVLHLGSWHTQVATFEQWLIDELSLRYGASPSYTQRWLQNDRLLPLLDGLDEVTAENRADCLKAINAFRRRRGVSAIVVCSRSSEYLELQEQLQLRSAIELQPLTPEQIDAYLGRLGTELAPLRQLVRGDTALQELVQTPLLLNILVLAYQGQSIQELQIAGTLEDQRRLLFDAYIQRMLNRRSLNRRYTPAQTIAWLAWLAHTLLRHQQNILLLEHMQPDWMQREQQRRYIRLVGLLRGVAIGLMVGLLIGPLLFLPVRILWPDSTVGLSSASIVGGTLATTLLSVLVFGVFAFRIAKTRPTEKILVVETLSWSPRTVRKALASGLLLGAIIGGVTGWAFGVGWGLLYGSTIGLMLGLLMFARGLDWGELEIEQKITPNQGIRRSALNAALMSVGVGLSAGVGMGLLLNIALGEIFTFTGGVPFGLGIAIAMFLFYGGEASVMHLLLRFMLYRADMIPRDYVNFLNYAVERIFLRRVGGGYLFIHRLVLEHFATLYREPTEQHERAD